MKVFPEKKTFYEADHECQTLHGGHLVSIHGDKKNDAVVSAMANSPHGNGEYFWIGLQESLLDFHNKIRIVPFLIRAWTV